MALYFEKYPKAQNVSGLTGGGRCPSTASTSGSRVWDRSAGVQTQAEGCGFWVLAGAAVPLCEPRDEHAGLLQGGRHPTRSTRLLKRPSATRRPSRALTATSEGRRARSWCEFNKPSLMYAAFMGKMTRVFFCLANVWWRLSINYFSAVELAEAQSINPDTLMKFKFP